MATGKWISYVRVSTAKQGRSGLGLEAQRTAIRDFLNGGDWELLTEYQEIESGKNNARPELKKALEDCRRRGATLLIAKLDRLSRDAHFLLGLQKSGVDFVAVDMPSATPFTVGIMAVVAEDERRRISDRTKAALAAAKARGAQLGNNGNLTRAAAVKGRKLGNKANQDKADEFAQRIYPRIAELQGQGMTLRAIARQLNDDRVITARGTEGNWTHQAVKAVIERIERKV